MDGIVNQFEYVLVSLRYWTTILTCCESHRAAWNTGVWAWDCVHEDHVVVIPFVAALLGDNPMQSEFACHVGPGGKLLCRICDVKGRDASMDGSQPSAATISNDSANGGCTTPDLTGTSDSDGDGNSSAGDTSAPANGRKRKLETMQEIVERVTRFIQTGSPRTRGSTLQELRTIIADAGSVGNVSKIRAHKTSTGIKDTFLETYLGLMHQSYKSKASRHEKQTALDNFRATLPTDVDSMLSPVWRIRGRFTLHCVLRHLCVSLM
jgi:hypothetical protein